jgi:hypothetical protein
VRLHIIQKDIYAADTLQPPRVLKKIQTVIQDRVLIDPAPSRGPFPNIMKKTLQKFSDKAVIKNMEQELRDVKNLFGVRVLLLTRSDIRRLTVVFLR